MQYYSWGRIWKQGLQKKPPFKLFQREYELSFETNLIWNRVFTWTAVQSHPPDHGVFGIQEFASNLVSVLDSNKDFLLGLR